MIKASRGMYRYYIFDLYGPLIDLTTDEDMKELWEKMAEYYTEKGALYSAEDLRKSYCRLCGDETAKNKITKYP